MPKLTDRQKEFVRQYLVDLNATQAAIRAGYSERTASRIGPQLLGKTCVREAIEKAQAKRAQRVEVTQDYVLSNLVEVVERTMQRAPVLDRKGEQVQDVEDVRRQKRQPRVGAAGQALGHFRRQGESGSFRPGRWAGAIVHDLGHQRHGAR